ncbi:DUF4239 domain-containing protein [Allokutzneria multivorans]|uniref:DUF4239 domain-containing protein n=1 Tax=Allokutzneria multivorans TaxID=1142134 RepID=A0ABP7S6C1_9PSEU
MNIYTIGLLWVLGASAVAATIAVVLQTKFGWDDERNNSSAGSVFAVVGGLHAVLVAFVLISLFDAAAKARSDSAEEANALVAVHWAGSSLPEPTKDLVKELSRSYAATVLNEEWPRLREGEPVATSGALTLERLKNVIAEAKPDGDWQESRQAEAANQLWQVYQSRQARLEAAGKGVNSVVWFALIIGGIMSVSFPYLFGGPNLIPHVIIVVALTATITLLLFAISQMENPFSGGAQVNPDAFRAATERLL